MIANTYVHQSVPTPIYPAQSIDPRTPISPPPLHRPTYAHTCCSSAAGSAGTAAGPPPPPPPPCASIVGLPLQAHAPTTLLAGRFRGFGAMGRPDLSVMGGGGGAVDRERGQSSHGSARTSGERWCVRCVGLVCCSRRLTDRPMDRSALEAAYTHDDAFSIGSIDLIGHCRS